MHSDCNRVNILSSEELCSRETCRSEISHYQKWYAEVILSNSINLISLFIPAKKNNLITKSIQRQPILIYPLIRRMVLFVKCHDHFTNACSLSKWWHTVWIAATIFWNQKFSRDKIILTVPFSSSSSFVISTIWFVSNSVERWNGSASSVYSDRPPVDLIQF